MIGQSLTSITNLDLLVDTESIVLDNNLLTALPELPDTGHLVTLQASTNQLTSVTNFASTLITISIGDNPALTSLPTIPVPCLTLDISLNTAFTAAEVNTVLGQLVTNNQNNGTVGLVSMDISTSGANIATLTGRGWTIIT